MERVKGCSANERLAAAESAASMNSELRYASFRPPLQAMRGTNRNFNTESKCIACTRPSVLKYGFVCSKTMLLPTLSPVVSTK